MLVLVEMRNGEQGFNGTVVVRATNATDPFAPWVSNATTVL